MYHLRVTKSEKKSKLKVLLHLLIYHNSGHVIIHYYKGIEDFYYFFDQSSRFYVSKKLY